MKVKNSIKKVGAVAGSALMVGLSVGAAASLSEFPQPFVDDDGEVASQIVVGSSGQVADVVGAVNIAAALGQDAVQTTTEDVPGATTTNVDGATDDTEIRGSWTGATFDASDYSELRRDTVEADDGDEHRVLEQVHLQNTGLDAQVDNESATFTEISNGDVQYEVSYTPGYEELETMSILGEDYTLTSIESGSEIKLGSKMEHRNLAAGDEIEHGPWSFEIIDVDRDDNEVRLDIYEDGDFVDSATLGDGGSDEFGDNNEFMIEIDDIWFGDALDQVHIDTTYSDTTVEEGEDSPFDSDWEVDTISMDSSNDHVEGITLKNKMSAVESPSDDADDNEVDALWDGDSFAGPADYFEVMHNGLTGENGQSVEDEEIDFATEAEVTFDDANHLENTVDLTEFVDGQSIDLSSSPTDTVAGVNNTDGEYFPVTISDYNDGPSTWHNITLEYQGWEQQFDVDDGTPGASDAMATHSTGYGFDVTVNATSTDTVDIYGTAPGSSKNLTTSFGAEMTWDGQNATITEDPDTEANEINVEYDGTPDNLQAVYYENDDSGTTVQLSDTDDGEESLTWWGSHVDLPDDTSATVTYPEDQLFVQHAVGSSETSESDSDETYEALGDQSDLPDMAQLDSDVTESVRDNNHLILVGGPAVNTLTEELHNSGDLDLSELEDSQSGAVLQVVEDAFSSGQHAMVVAGYAADDTRSASQYIAQHRTNADALSDAGNRMVLSEADYPTEQ